MNADWQRTGFLLLGTVVGYGLLMRFNPVRPSLRDGWRCLRRYPQIWLLPTACNVAHALYGLGMRWLESRAVPGAPPLFRTPDAWQPPPWREVLTSSLLPAFEGAAAPFNCLTTVYPLSALVAVLFFLNWGGYHTLVRGALVRRLGLWMGALVYAGLTVCAAAALCKPVFFGGLTRLNAFFGAVALVRTGEIINWASFVFEYVAGVGLQIYLVLLCFAWVRGLSFHFDSLRRFALRRFAFVVRWALVMIGLSSLGINLPLVADAFAQRGQTIEGAWVGAAVWFSRWLLAVVALLFCSMQITLIFHNESLRQATLDHVTLLRRHGERVGWLVVTAGLHFLLLVGVNAFLLRALGEQSWPAAVWSVLFYPVCWTALAAWLLASWVCLFRRCEIGKPDVEELVVF